MAVAIFPIGSHIIIYGHRQGRKDMKLTGELKKQVEKADSMDEKKRLIEEAGMELTDEEMNQVAGGSGIKGNRTSRTYPIE